MAPRNKKKIVKTKKRKYTRKPKVQVTAEVLPKLVQVGKHYINPKDVRCISQVRPDLYIVKFLSDPNPQFATWVKAADIPALLKHFNVVADDNDIVPDMDIDMDWP